MTNKWLACPNQKHTHRSHFFGIRKISLLKANAGKFHPVIFPRSSQEILSGYFSASVAESLLECLLWFLLKDFTRFLLEFILRFPQEIFPGFFQNSRAVDLGIFSKVLPSISSGVSHEFSGRVLCFTSRVWLEIYKRVSLEIFLKGSHGFSL